MYRRKAGMSYVLRRRWSPPRYGLCPRCEHELVERMKEQGIKPPKPVAEPPREPPEWVEIKPRGGGGGGGSGGKGEEKERKEGRGEGWGKGKGEGAGRGKGGGEGPLNVSPEDVEKARMGSEDVNEEFEEMRRIKVDETTPMFQPLVGAGPASSYRDQGFISKMRAELKEWRAGYVEKAGKHGARLKVKEYIRSRGKRPFVTRIRKSAKGRKILFVADFSGSIDPFQEEYKRAIVSALEVLDNVGVKTALFGFGGEMGDSPLNSFFFRIKKFEDPKWTMNHASKVAVLQAGGGTPTSRAYLGLENYIKTHRPDLTVTLTDGEPDSPSSTEEMIKRLKRYTRMVAFGIGSDRDAAKRMEDMLKDFGYNKVFAVSVGEMNKLPKKLVDLIAPT